MKKYGFGRNYNGGFLANIRDSVYSIISPLSFRERVIYGLLLIILLAVVISPSIRATKPRYFAVPSTNCSSDEKWLNESFASGLPEKINLSVDEVDINKSAISTNELSPLICKDFNNDENTSFSNLALDLQIDIIGSKTSPDINFDEISATQTKENTQLSTLEIEERIDRIIPNLNESPLGNSEFLATVQYSTDNGKTWSPLHSLDFNNINSNKHLSISLPSEIESIEGLAFKIESVVSGNTNSTIVLDSMFLTYTVEIKEEVDFQLINQDGTRIVEEEPVLDGDKPLELNIKTKPKNDGLPQGIVNKVTSNIGSDSSDNIQLNTKIINQDGDVIQEETIDGTQQNTDLTNTTTYKSELEFPDSMDPGKYTLEVIYKSEDGTVTTLKQNFLWGVLAINTDRDVYSPGDRAKLDLAVLDEKGRTVCDAKLNIQITNPSGQVSQFSNESGITKSEYCTSYGEFKEPDYSLELEISEIGEYEVLFIAETANGTQQMKSSFNSNEENPVSIKRYGPTRMYPPEPAEMIIEINSKDFFSGKVTETIPASFEALSPDSYNYVLSKNDGADTQQLEWDITIQPGETKILKYRFKIPDISPEFYLISPLEMSGPFNYTEARSWQIAGDAIGYMLILWDGTTSPPPSGWTCISCSGGDLENRFIRGNTTYGVSAGGNATHTHTATASVGSSSATSTESNSGSNISDVSHSHPNFSPTLNSPSNLPSYSSLSVLRSTTQGNISSLPAGAIAIFDASVPAGWTQYATQDNLYIRGEATSGNTGGSNTHTVSISGSTSAASTTVEQKSRGGPPQTTGALSGHTHTISGTSAPTNHEPPYIEVILGKKNTSGAPVDNMITMWDDEPPSGWLEQSSSGKPFYQKFIKPTTSYGTTGGSSTHSHSDTTGLTSGVPSGTTNGKTGPAGASPTHTHTVNVTGYSTENHLPPYWDVIFAKKIPQPAFEQSAYRFYANDDSTDVGSPLAAQDTNANAPEQGTPFRLRMTMHISSTDLVSSGTNFKLQYAVRSGTCDTSFTGETYNDVDTSSGAIRFYDNTTPSNDDALTGNANDPVHSGHTNSDQAYVESNTFTNSQGAISTGDDGLWDFSLVDFSAPENTSYCFRIVKSDDSTLDTYTVIPEILTDTQEVELSAYRWFDNTDSTDVGSPRATQDTAMTAPAQGTPFRLRLNLHVLGSGLASSGETYKLQISARSGTCDSGFTGESYVDVATASGAIRYHDNTTPTDGSALTDNANDPVHSGDTNNNQTYEEANNFTNSQSAIPAGEDGVWDFSLVDFSSAQDTSYCLRVVTSAGGLLDTYTVIPEFITAGVEYEQSAYRFYNNSDSTDVGSTLAAQDTAANAPAQGTPFRLRMNLHISGTALSSSGQSFKLQYAEQSGTCDTTFTGESYTDVETSSGGIRFYNNSTSSDGSALTANANDPVHGADANVNQTYEESNNFTNSGGAISVGQDGLWDFSLVDFSGKSNTAYCFRIVKDNGATLNTYTVIPQITTTAVNLEQSAYRFFENDDSTDVGSPLAAQDTAATAPYQGNAFRLRMNIHITNRDFAVADGDYKLQFAQQSGTCDTSFTGESYADVDTSSGAIRFFDNATPNDGDSLTDNTNDPAHSGHTNTNQTYEESNNFTTNTLISIGDDGLWDFSLVDFSATPTTTYCFRIVHSDNSLLDTYTVIPEITTEAAIGSMILYFDGATIPDGWSCISCNIGDDFYQRFARGETTYGTTGGNPTHNHSATGTVSQSGDAGVSENDINTGAIAFDHNHDYTPVFENISNLPNYRDLKVIKRDGSGPVDTLPEGVIGIFNDTVPSGWTQYAAQDGYFIRGDANAGSPNGSNTHSHTITGSTTAPVSGTVYNQRTGGSTANISTDTHTHTVSSNSDSQDKIPPYLDVILGKKDSAGAAPDELIAMWDDTLPTEYNLLSGTTGPFYQIFTKAETTYGGTGGTTSHTHGDVTGITSSSPVGVAIGRVGSSGANHTHTHQVDVTSVVSSDHLPPYINVIYGSKNRVPDSPTNLDQIRTTATTSMAVGEWTDETQVTFEADISDPDNPETLQLCVEVDIIGTGFSNTEDQCSTGVAYSGTAVTASVTVTGLTANQEYHWQVRTRDSKGDYSAWTSFGANAESARDFGIDTTDPTGTVFDGSSIGVDVDYNNGALDELSANWSFNFDVSGQNGNYDYSIGTTPGGTDVLNWTSTASTSVTATSLILNTSQPYYFNVRATDNAGHQVTISSDGQFVSPTLSFSVSPTELDLGNLNTANSFIGTGTTTLTTSTNAYNGYEIRGFASGLMANQYADTIAGFDGGTYVSPDEWLSGDRGYGYSSSDTTIQGANKFNSTPCAGGGNPPCYAPWSLTAPGDIIADHTDPISGTPVINEQFTISHRVQVDATQAQGVYGTTIIYVITAIY